VRSTAYFYTLLRYIDLNAVDAGLVEDLAQWEFGSARHYLEARGPRWLTRDPVERLIRGNRDPTYDPALYRKVLELPLRRGERELVERRMATRGDHPDPLDDLLATVPGLVRSWLEAQARVADGVGRVMPVVTPDALRRSLAGVRERLGARRIRTGRTSIDAYEVLESTLLGQFCGLTQVEVRHRTGRSRIRIVRNLERHRGGILNDPGYADLAAEVLRAALATEHGAIRL
jgi:hypothetical protein